MAAVVAGTLPTLIGAVVGGSGASAETVRVSPTGSVTVHWRGNGHGHGMSQYGAEGAALAGLTTAQILAFYYPHTTLTTVAPSTIRVKLSNDAAPSTTVLPTGNGLSLTGFGALPTSGYSLFRLVPSGSGLKLQGRKPAGWRLLKDGLPARADFSTKAGWVQVLDADGSSTRYHGTVGAVRSGASEITVNRVSLDLYVQGSVPREVPSSWEPAAVQAQAVAARSYADAVRSWAGSGSLYDICDTTSCQAYGGMAHYDSAGVLLWSDDPDAIAGNQNTVLRYQGAPVLAQYSASDGGATVDGGEPYLIGRADPYDNAASGDPYLDQSTSVSASSLAHAFGLQTVTSVAVTQRDGNGPWGGRIVKATVVGTNSSGGAAQVATDGFTLGDAFGVWTDYLLIDSTDTAPSAPAAVTVQARDAGATVAWRAPQDDGGSPVTGYRVRFGGHTLALPASARSAYVGPVSNQVPTTVHVLAVNAVGTGAAATTSVTGAAAPARVVPVAPRRILDTRDRTTPVDPDHPFRITVPGQGDIPASGVTAVQLSVTVRRASSSGVLRITPSGVFGRPLAAIAYRAGHPVTTTVSVPLTPSGTLVLRPSAGQVVLFADQESYSASSGLPLTTAPKQRVATVADVPLGRGAVLDLSGLRGISASTTGVLLAIDATSSSASFLRVWSGGPRPPSVRHVAVSPDASGANTVIVPLGAYHRLHLAAGSAGVDARVSLLGTVGGTGGALETFPPSPIADDAATPRATTAGTDPGTLQVAGIGQIPASGVNSVLMQLTVVSDGTTGALWVAPGARAAAPSKAPVLRFAGTGATSSTALVRLGTGGTVVVRSSVPNVRVSIDAIGYITKR